MENEVFISIFGFEGLYEVSNMGNIKRIGRLITNNKNVSKFYKTIILAPGLRNGYQYVHLHKNKTFKTFKVHSLVAAHFVNKVEGKHQINHINGVKTDNRSVNLEWCTPRENVLHAYKTGLNPGRKRIHPSLNILSKSVEMVDLETGSVLKTFTSMREAADETGIATSTICLYTKNKVKRKKKFDWKLTGLNRLQPGCLVAGQ